MNITKKLDRAFQWAGEKMGSEAKTTMSDEFRMLETEMALRHDGMERLQRSMNAYVKWLGRRGETFEDKEKGLPIAYLGRTMASHGEDFETDSEFGNCLVAMGRANERAAAYQEHFVADATTYWLDSLERSLAMMKEYQAARKKLENRRLAYDASITKVQKAKRDDFRVEEELRTAKAKYEESSEDVVRRMQDIKDAEADSVRDLTRFLDAELDYHERCAEELRRVRANWPGSTTGAAAGGGFNGSAYGGSYGGAVSLDRRPTGRSRSNTAQSLSDRLGLSRTNSNNNSRNNIFEEQEPEPELPPRMPIRSSSRLSTHGAAPPETAARPPMGRANTFQGPAGGAGASVSRVPSGATTPNYGQSYNSSATLGVGSLRGQLRPVSRIQTGSSARDDVFADHHPDDDTASGSGSPDWAERSASPATSFGSLSRSTSALTVGGSGSARKAPPPPPPSRAKKPPPPVPAKREMGY
ncbi:BAR domain-containing protein [Pleurostoma richardsiae]|uniref:BAR domain-containing protein n=1 Tax=Pleurostoma richardsiae TaxID=41990 RepID=A0AA38RM74_9PEZI|nr:BAR domain-containing protein [Pleurostoma richardsiae]